MYNKGDLQITDPDCPDSVVRCKDWPEYGHEHLVFDSRSGGEMFTHPSVYLPHSCDEWVIGGVDNVRVMIEDLMEALKIIEGENDAEDNQPIQEKL